jgi:transcriptional regulator with PAS, ATPase and Fis domain
MDLIGAHPATQELRRVIERVALSPARTVMLYGETGTGKSMVSQMIHARSERARSRFVDLNCAAIPSNLMESELFGHEKGSFTGAVARKQGLIELADRGTLFLDEISELDLVLQAKLLNFLDSHRIRRIGGLDSMEVDTRIIGATNKMLLTEAGRGLFREDLFYRLQLVFIGLPPLRERGDDVFLLAEHYMEKLGKRYNKTITDIAPDVRDIFRVYPWPGNIRELSHLIERMFILFDSTRIELQHLPPRMVDPEFWSSNGRQALKRDHVVARPSPRPAPEFPIDLDGALAGFERDLIEAALRRHDHRASRAAASLGLTRHMLRHRMVRLGMRFDDKDGIH